MREPLVSFHSAEELRSALWPQISPHRFRANLGADLFQPLVDRNLPPLVSIRAMGVILGVNPKLITSMARFPKKYYRAFMIRKKSGGERMIYAPRVFLKTVQRYVLRAILETRPLPPHVHGFVSGRGIVTNAAMHRSAPYVLNVDLKDFFDSVREDAVRHLFMDFGFGERVARTLAGLCIFQGSLPQGAPTSPYLANLAFAPVDAEILQLCAERDFTYSRYADDLTFSARSKIPRQFLGFLEFVLRRHGFRINSQKTRFSGPGQALYVTGLVVNDKVHPNREVRRKLRAIFHQAAAHPSQYWERSAEILGWASFVNSYDHALGEKYLTIARRLNLLPRLE
ncbi:MAG: reverse transcriptase family protein [Candidatus Sulfotelmatobacter sp.]